MVRTRAQRGKGLATPSPRIKGKIAGEVIQDNNTTPKARRGTVREKNLMSNKQLTTQTPKGKDLKEKKKAQRRSASQTAEDVKAEEDETTDKLSVEKSPTKRSGRKKQKEKSTELEEDETTDERLVEQSPTKRSGRKKQKEKRTETKEDSSNIESLSVDSEGEILCNGDDDDDDGIEDESGKVDKKGVKRTMKSDDEDEQEEEGDDDDDDEEEEEEQQQQQQQQEKVESNGEEKDEAKETRESNSHLKAERLGDGEPEEGDGEDSDAPEDVSFSRSRQEALDSISQALQQSRKTEDLVKAKRRKRDKLLKLQKEKKKISLQHSRLPDEFLAEIKDLPIQKEELTVAPKTPGQSQPKKCSQHKMFDSDGEDNVEDAISGDDFIPFATDQPCVKEGFEVHAISRQQRAPPPKSESALDFLQNQLYGSKIKRESVNKHQSRMMKRHGRPAMVFLKEKKRKL